MKSTTFLQGRNFEVRGRRVQSFEIHEIGGKFFLFRGNFRGARVDKFVPESLKFFDKYSDSNGDKETFATAYTVIT